MSTMIISSTPAAHESRQSGSISSSSLTIMQSEMLTLSAAEPARRGRSFRNPRIAFTAWRSRGGSETLIGRFTRIFAAWRLPARFSRFASMRSAACRMRMASAASFRPNSATPTKFSSTGSAGRRSSHGRMSSTSATPRGAQRVAPPAETSSISDSQVVFRMR